MHFLMIFFKYFLVEWKKKCNFATVIRVNKRDN